MHDLTALPHTPEGVQGAPFGRGSAKCNIYIGKQNAVRTILGRLVSSLMRKNNNINMSILEDAIVQAYSLDSL